MEEPATAAAASPSESKAAAASPELVVLEEDIAFPEQWSKNQEQEVNELHDAFINGAANLKICFDENMMMLTSVFKEKLSSHKQYRDQVENHYKNVHKKLTVYKESVIVEHQR